MVIPAKLASAKCIAVYVFLFIVCFSIYFVCLFCLLLFFYCLFNWSTEMAVLT